MARKKYWFMAIGMEEIALVYLGALGIICPHCGCQTDATGPKWAKCPWCGAKVSRGRDPVKPKTFKKPPKKTRTWK